jgi:hypothetical protein
MIRSMVVAVICLGLAAVGMPFIARWFDRFVDR